MRQTHGPRRSPLEDCFLRLMCCLLHILCFCFVLFFFLRAAHNGSSRLTTFKVLIHQKFWSIINPYYHTLIINMITLILLIINFVIDIGIYFTILSFYFYFHTFTPINLCHIFCFILGFLLFFLTFKRLQRLFYHHFHKFIFMRLLLIDDVSWYQCLEVPDWNVCW